ncbi:MAG: hypothetical protein RMJ67_06050 [Elusimicrobiota bacterium]|nr:hypothetical protein [Endomicrobiia bacterium]MDW8166055.1 hypothetical protein [Elusimicrobiota bacterium]
MSFEKILEIVIKYEQLLNALGYAFLVYFYFKVAYEIKNIKLMLENHISEIRNEIKLIKDEFEIRERKFNLHIQKVINDISKSEKEIDFIKQKLKQK